MYMKTKQTNKQTKGKKGEKEIDSSFWIVCSLPFEDL